MKSVLIAILLSFATTNSGTAATTVRPTPVEVVTPKLPTPVVVDGKRVLVYELHITNFGSKPFDLRRIEIFGPAPSTAVIAQYSEAELPKMLKLVGDLSGTADARHLDAGRRVIAFIFLPLALEQPVPDSLRHRFSFTTSDPSSTQPAATTSDSSINDIIVPVLRNSLPVLGSPFAEGDWLASNGPSNTSVHRRSLTSLNGKTYIAQRFAIDWVLVGKNGDTLHDGPSKNENFWAYGQPVHAVADGEVTELVDEFPDNTPRVPLKEVTIANITGNHIIIRIAPDQYILFAHLKAGSAQVHLHDRVKRGDVIAEVGNSGNTTGAHLHLEVMDGNSPLGAEGIPFIFDHFRFLGFGKDFEENHHPDVPHHAEIPADDMVVNFR